MWLGWCGFACLFFFSFLFFTTLFCFLQGKTAKVIGPVKERNAYYDRLAPARMARRINCYKRAKDLQMQQEQHEQQREERTVEQRAQQRLEQRRQLLHNGEEARLEEEDETDVRVRPDPAARENNSRDQIAKCVLRLKLFFFWKFRFEVPCWRFSCCEFGLLGLLMFSAPAAHPSTPPPALSLPPLPLSHPPAFNLRRTNTHAVTGSALGALGNAAAATSTKPARPRPLNRDGVARGGQVDHGIPHWLCRGLL